MAIRIDNKLTPLKLVPKINRLFELSAGKILSLEQTWDPVRGTPVFTVKDATLVVEIQKSLIRLGFDPGGVDGKLGPKTVEAIKQYQAKKGLLEDGNPAQPLLTHMLKNGG